MHTACRMSVHAGTEISRAISRISAFLPLTAAPRDLPQVMCHFPRENGNRGEKTLLDEDLDEGVRNAVSLQEFLNQVPRVAVDSPAVANRQVPRNLQRLAGA